MFPYINQLKERLKYPKEQMSFIVIDTFKGKDNDVTTDLSICHCSALYMPNMERKQLNFQ